MSSDSTGKSRKRLTDKAGCIENGNRKGRTYPKLFDSKIRSLKSLEMIRNNI